MKRTKEQIEALRAFNQVLCQRYEAHFGQVAPPRMGDVKAALLNECRKLIDGTPFGETMTEQDAKTMCLLTGWTYPHIRHMYNLKHATDKRYIEVLQDNGDWVTHSWRKTIMPTTEWQDLQKAMREAVMDYGMKTYREAAEKVCCYCGTHDDLGVDHKSRSFDEIMQTFITGYATEHGTYPAIKDGAMGQGRELADPDTLAHWIAYHDGAADFQILCRSCNSSKGKKSLQDVVERV